jgi:hypothetical protein
MSCPCPGQVVRILDLRPPWSPWAFRWPFTGAAGKGSTRSKLYTAVAGVGLVGIIGAYATQYSEICVHVVGSPSRLLSQTFSLLKPLGLVYQLNAMLLLPNSKARDTL